MSDQPPPDRASSDPSKQAAWDSASEAELEAALSRAAALAAELSGQIQSAVDPAASSGSALHGSPFDHPSTELGAELDQLEQLVSTTAAQLQSAENAPPVPSTGPAHTLPDFMAEFTAPHKPSARSAPEGSPSTVDDDLMTAPANKPRDRAMPKAAFAKPGVVGSGMMGVVGGAVNIAPLAVPRPGEPVAQAECERESRPGRATRLVAPLLVILQAFASMLELIDRPFARISGGVRRIVGWIAIALIVTSMLVFVRSVG